MIDYAPAAGAVGSVITRESAICTPLARLQFAEYEASLLQKIDKIAIPFYGKGEDSWTNRKNILFAQAERIMQQNK